MQRTRVRVVGKVQGVFFRAYTVREATRLCLCGWVRNCSDGTVEAEIEGPAEDVATMLTWLHKGSPLSHVSEVQRTDCKPLLNEKEFLIRY